MYDGSFIYSQKKKKKIKKTSKILSEREMKHFSTSEINSDRHQKAKALYLSHKGSKVGKKKKASVIVHSFAVTRQSCTTSTTYRPITVDLGNKYLGGKSLEKAEHWFKINSNLAHHCSARIPSADVQLTWTGFKQADNR